MAEAIFSSLQRCWPSRSFFWRACRSMAATDGMPTRRNEVQRGKTKTVGAWTRPLISRGWKPEGVRSRRMYRGRRLFHCGQHVAQRKRGEGGAVIGLGVGDDELSPVDQTAAGVNDVGHVAFALVFVGLDQRFAEAANDFGRIVQIQEECADAIFTHGAHAVAEDEPARLGLDGRAAIAHLNEFPG